MINQDKMKYIALNLPIFQISTCEYPPPEKKIPEKVNFWTLMVNGTKIYTFHLLLHWTDTKYRVK